MALQEILHLTPCPKHGVDNPHDQCKVTRNFLIYQYSVNTEYLLGSIASLFISGPRAKRPGPLPMNIEERLKQTLARSGR